ncbi:DSD1 family PLP-dependent enzyme [Sphingosinicella sp. BN140058]|uniref:DSD1 family PLP-dependent enzyme n=1 Tax=Sphingosinicella sp. BN140058 TaxID=1892855 RepID=UPI001010F2CC|nr:DSD1 family PLP-dependent enzyme [Sphingosinicella sp. BN140058]QAY76190.1 DSD1 family PLP-dependent enzyme [Sphingosinicella sp. BN140058]
MTPLRRADLPTPALVLDLPALERNVAAMAAWARDKGVALRPHSKTHKSGEIARRQRAAGAVGICCAKLGEAEALAADGIDDILITSPVVPGQAVERLARLARTIPRLAVVVDHPDNVDRIAEAVGDGGIDVMVDIDPGAHRTGVASASAAVALAGRIAASGGLRYRGVQYYCGTLQHVTAAGDRRTALAERADYLRTILAALAAAGLPAETVTGGGTGSFAIDAELGVLNEFQVGSYIFMDREYRDCEVVGPTFEQALAIDTRVISVNTPGRVTIDAGLKAMATDAGAPVVLSGTDPASRYVFMGDEHGMLITPCGGSDPGLGDLVTLVPPHCDPTVNLYDRYVVVKGDAVVAFWPVTARGRSA